MNGTFELSLEPNDDIFDITPKHVINEANFIIRVRNHTKIDYETVKQFDYKMIATELTKEKRSRYVLSERNSDEYSPSQTYIWLFWLGDLLSYVTLKIFIRDVNDNAPIFDEKQYDFSVLENSDIGTVVGQVRAIDIDSGNYGTEGIRYTKLTGSISKL